MAELQRLHRVLLKVGDKPEEPIVLRDTETLEMFVDALARKGFTYIADMKGTYLLAQDIDKTLRTCTVRTEKVVRENEQPSI